MCLDTLSNINVHEEIVECVQRTLKLKFKHIHILPTILDWPPLMHAEHARFFFFRENFHNNNNNNQCSQKPRILIREVRFLVGNEKQNLKQCQFYK